jgi:hypothetical protein
MPYPETCRSQAAVIMQGDGLHELVLMLHATVLHLVADQ